MRPVHIESGPPVTQADAARVDASALERALREAIAGEVRFDRVSRALYSTDASVYQIEPLGVVVARGREDVIATVRLCHEFRCPLTLRGGGTSQAGQAIGSGIVLDTSKYLNRVIDIDVERRIARVEPGIVLDELNAQLKPHNLRFAPDISTASRATLGGMMANNSAGARSVLYGITLHHVLEQQVVFADGTVAQLRDLSAAELDALCTEESTHGRGARLVRQLAADCAAEIDRHYPKLLRRVAGYNLNEFAKDQPFNLSRLIVGSEGTLAVVLEATVRLVPLPKAKAVMAIEFADLLEALAAAPVILRHQPSAIEVMDKFILDYTKQNAELQRRRETFIAGDPGALLCVEFYAEREDELPPRLDALERELRDQKLGYRYFHALDLAAQARIWSVREAGLGLSMAMKDDNKSLSFVEDTAVAPERLRDYIERFLQIVRAHGTAAGVYAHASVGCLHVRPVVNLKTEAGVRTFESLATAISDLVLEFGGALSGEHGDGLVRSPFMRKMFGPVLYDAFREIKRTFDPHGILNPGKIVDAPPLTTNLRYGPTYRSQPPPTWFDYTPWGGMSGAVEMCSGLGACRKTLDGTMCPSYMVTKEEAHSTRGRANTLRLVMAGRLDESGLGDDGVREVLDLCLECRACKAECPVGVDVARFKSEFLADYWSRHGTPLRARALGHIHTLSKWASWMPSLANAMAGSTVARAVNERVLGIHRERALPRWAARTLRSQWENESAARPDVFLFNDTFTNYFHPEIGVAAREVLTATGSSVALAGNVCCGRPLISQGLLQEARELAARNTRYLSSLFSPPEGGHYANSRSVRLQADHDDVRSVRLQPDHDDARSVRLQPDHDDARSVRLQPDHEDVRSIRLQPDLVFLEPSCLSAMREDVPALLRGEEQQQALRVAEACVSFEEFMGRMADEGRPAASAEATAAKEGRPLPFALTSAGPRRDGPSRILLHGHCHQKSMGGLAAAKALLERMTGVAVTDLDAGCCGMAGSFGYAREHFDVSRQIAERRLLPAARRLKDGEVLVAAGTSCRQQVSDFTGVRALHPAELLRSLLP